MKKILVLGIGGMAGHIIYSKLKTLNKYNLAGTIRHTTPGGEGIQLDVSDPAQLKEVLENNKPDIVINCIGMLIRGSKMHPASTVLINAFLPHFIKETIETWNGRLIHISTDCVFNGLKGNYTEDAPKDALDLYGQSKALGEIIDDSNLTIRTSIIGPELKNNGEGLFNWFMHQSGKISGYTAAYWSGVTTLELAKFIIQVIEKPITGLYHLTNNDKINKYELLQLFRKIYNKNNVEIEASEGKKVDKSFINTRTAYEYTVPSYQTMIEEQEQYMANTPHLYQQYIF